MVEQHGGGLGVLLSDRSMLGVCRAVLHVPALLQGDRHGDAQPIFAQCGAAGSHDVSRDAHTSCTLRRS